MGKKNKNTTNTIQVSGNDKKNKEKKSYVLESGCREEKELIAPSSISLYENELKVENFYSRTFAINGYPETVYVRFLDTLYSYKNNIDVKDIDVAIHAEPIKARSAQDKLTAEITKYEAQLITETEKGSNKNITFLQNKIRELYEQRAKLERKIEKMFSVTTLCAIYSPTKEELNKQTQKLVSVLDGETIMLDSLTLRHHDGYKSVSPFGLNYVTGYNRNMNSQALTAMFPFYDADINHPKGTFVAMNENLNTPVYIDFFNKKLLPNANLFVSGMSGSGKTYFSTLLINRSTINEQVMHIIFDPEGEYGDSIKAIGGVDIKLAPGEKFNINPFDIKAEVEVDRNGEPTGRQTVNIKQRIADIITMFSVMFKGLINNDVIVADISEALQGMYQSFGFTEDPASLYMEEQFFNEDTEEYVNRQILKTMPRMSDCRDYLIAYAESNDKPYLENIISAMKIYCDGGIYDMFDCYTKIYDELDISTVSAIVFDLSRIDDDKFRPVAMHILASFVWNNIIKNDLKTKKRIVYDEAWTALLDPYTAGFLEKIARRIRKYNGSLMCISQNSREFAISEQGQAILSNSAVKIFFKHSPEDIAAVGSRFLLSDGEKTFLLSAAKTEMLIKIDRESVKGYSYSFDFEDKLISRAYLNNN